VRTDALKAGGAGRSLSLDGPLWRRLARWGSLYGPEWFVRFSPPFIGLVVCLLAGAPRRQIRDTLRLVRGPRGHWRDAMDVLRTFSTYASCLAETLSADSGDRRLPEVVVHGEEHLDRALAGGRGLVIVTAHTAGWEAAGSCLRRRRGVPVMIVEEPEADAVAAMIQDAARGAYGVVVTHVGRDPLSALPLVRHLRGGGIVALQLDRVRRGMSTVPVKMFGSPALVPEGPARLCMLTGAAMVPAFASRVGFRRYEVDVGVPILLSRTAVAADVAVAAQRAADALERFVRAHPTQWFHFRGG